MQSAIISRSGAGYNFTDSPTYSCNTSGTPIIDTPSPYCVVHGGAKRMAICCAESSNGTSQVNFKPDCYLWCNVDLAPYTGVLPEGQGQFDQALRKFSTCLEQGQDPSYTPELSCANGTGVFVTPKPSPSASLSPSTSTRPPIATFTGSASKTVGSGAKLAVGLIVLQVAFGAFL